MTTETEPTLFPVPPAAAPSEYAAASADRRRTMRQQARLAAGRHPLHGGGLRVPAGETCATCAHAVNVAHGARRYWKCDAWSLSRGAASDLRLKWPACIDWQAKP